MTLTTLAKSDSLQILDDIQSLQQDGDRVSTSQVRSIIDRVEKLIYTGEIHRRRYFGNTVQIHIINNLRNGYCQEDCGYCAQRKQTKSKRKQYPIAAYTRKQTAEVMQEVKHAVAAGAYRYCLVSAGRGPSSRDINYYCQLIEKIKSHYSIQVCLSAGLVHDPTHAQKLKQAGLDRYNHNFNSSKKNYASFCKTHSFQDRLKTLQTIKQAGISLCSGVIIGLGESNREILEMAQRCADLQIPSIPINFFLPVPGHEIKDLRFVQNINHKSSASEKSAWLVLHCLTVLAIFRNINPKAEIRLAAGREIYLNNYQSTALRVANSLFAQGYLNVRGSEAMTTRKLIEQSGFIAVVAGVQSHQEVDTISVSVPQTNDTDARDWQDNILSEFITSNHQETCQQLYLKSAQDLYPSSKC